MIPEVIVLPDPPALAQEAARRFCEIAVAAAAARGRCIVALSGGSTPALFHRALAHPPWRERIPWPRLHVCWGDERCVPPDHPESNYGAVRRDLLADVPLPAQNIHRMAGEQEPAAAAQEYEAELRRLLDTLLPLDRPRSLALDCQVQRSAGRDFPVQAEQTPARFDLIVLGLGLDGHIASLFPGSPALDETERLVVATVSPAGQPRLTLTLPALNAARHLLVLVTGAAKAGIVARVLGAPQEPPLPAQRLKPADGTLAWLLDRAAAADL